jgi:hypothetical protein
VTAAQRTFRCGHRGHPCPISQKTIRRGPFAGGPRGVRNRTPCLRCRGSRACHSSRDRSSPRGAPASRDRCWVGPAGRRPRPAMPAARPPAALAVRPLQDADGVESQGARGFCADGGRDPSRSPLRTPKEPAPGGHGRRRACRPGVLLAPLRVALSASARETRHGRRVGRAGRGGWRRQRRGGGSARGAQGSRRSVPRVRQRGEDSVVVGHGEWVSPVSGRARADAHESGRRKKAPGEPAARERTRRNASLGARQRNLDVEAG